MRALGRFVGVLGLVACAPARPVAAVDGDWLGRMPTAAPTGRATAGKPSARAPGETARLELVGLAAPELGGLQPVGDAFPEGLAGLRGHVVLVDFWASWCVPCRVGVDALARYHARFGERGLRVLGVADDALPEAAAAARDWAIPYPVAADPSQRTQGAYHIDILPTLVVIDKRGVVRDVVSGYSAAETAAVGALVERLLAEPG